MEGASSRRRGGQAGPIEDTEVWWPLPEELVLPGTVGRGGLSPLCGVAWPLG